MERDGFNPSILRWCAWSGIIFCIMWLGGAGPTTGWLYIPPPSAADEAVKTVGDYTANTLGIQIGVTICMFSSIFYTAWGAVVTMMTKKIEGDYPILFYLQMVSLAACVVIVMLISFFWAATSFRAGVTESTVTQGMNDLGWLGLLYTGAPFATYQIALGAAILADKSERPVYPRWSGFLNFFVSFFMLEAAGMLFFKTGPFSQNGLMVFYLPMFVFFAWLLLFTRLALRAINAEVAVRGWATNPGRVSARAASQQQGFAQNP